MNSESQNNVHSFVPFLHELADYAAKAILPHFRTALHVSNKAGHGEYDPVTRADRDAEEVMRTIIRDRYPDHGILGEEFGPENLDAEFVWVLDPIDGTRAFVSGLPLWGVLIGLRRFGEPVLGMLSQPYIGERFWGFGGEAWLAASSGQRSLATRKCAALSDATLSTTSPALFLGEKRAMYDAVENQVRLVRYGYDCYAYAMLATGFIDCVIESGLKPYDIEPLVPLIEGAGGHVRDWADQTTDGRHIIAAGDKRLLEEALDVMATSSS